MLKFPDRLYSLFNIRDAKQNSRQKLLSSSARSFESQGVFITPQSIMTFPVASSIVSTLQALFGKIFPNYCGSNYSLMAIALAIGLFIWLVGITDPKTTNTRRDIVISFFIAVLNSCCLAMTALGIKTSIG